MVVVIATGTVYALVHGTRQTKLAIAAVPSARTDQAMYTGIGRIRAATGDVPAALVLVHVVFPYDSADYAFRDELSLKRDILRASALRFFAERTAAELRTQEEALIKTGLRDTLNQDLMLGTIDELYFAEFDVLP